MLRDSHSKLRACIHSLSVLARVVDCVIWLLLLLYVVSDGFALVVDKYHLTALVFAYHFLESLVVV